MVRSGGRFLRQPAVDEGDGLVHQVLGLLGGAGAARLPQHCGSDRQQDGEEDCADGDGTHGAIVQASGRLVSAGSATGSAPEQGALPGDRPWHSGARRRGP